MSGSDAAMGYTLLALLENIKWHVENEGKEKRNGEFLAYVPFNHTMD